MKLLFNRNGEGSAEMKQLLGWLNTTLRYKNIESDIDLETPRLIEFISQPVYDHIYNLYKTNSNEEVDKDLIKYAQLYISCMAYLSYASNNDLSHGSTGRKQYKADNESAAWEWQIKADEGATMRRAYKALDRLIDLLNKIKLQEWIDSKAFTASKELLIQSTDDLDKIEPINNSGQLYYRLVAYMQLAEIEHVNPILDNETLTIIKTGTDLDANQKLVRLHAQRLTAYTALADAYQTFPLEMFPGDINYAAGANYKHTVTGNKTLFYKERAQSTALALQNAYQALKGYEKTYSLPDNSDTSKKFINL